MSTISNTDETIDSRDVVNRIEELRSERECLEADLGLWDETEQPDDYELALGELEDWDESEEADELKALDAFEDEIKGYCPDWLHGATLIHEDYFTEYAEELARDCYEIPEGWPACHIDWDSAAEALKIDYTEADFDGQTYLVR